MDFLTYRTRWSELPNDPSVRIVARRSVWDLAMGGHPYRVDGDSAIVDTNTFADGGNPRVSAAWQMDPRGVVDGHNVLTDATLTSLLETDNEVPISPLFVKDLAGRAIYIGHGPERKDVGEWHHYGATKTDKDGNLENPIVPLITFPRKCRDVKGRMVGAELLETVFFTKFRALDMNRDYVGRPSGAPEDVVVQGFYPMANLYPYKLRLDTFYIDGWKLPQTQMLYARWQGIRPADAKKLGDGFIAQWAKRKDGADYQTWIDAQGGEKVIDDLFQKGCTVIPTFEACNGFNVVGREFELEEFWPGRAVTGLHEAVEVRADKAPIGTILDVVEPGFITSMHIHPAKVVVSDGSQYVSPNIMDPLPLVPNLHLPHQRTLANWEATWVPTHPEHFEVPALFGWDVNTGRFLQLTGPIWDPLHYYYESVPLVLKAFEKPLPGNRWLAPVPEDMQARFYPVIPMQGFDAINFDIYERRAEQKILPESAIQHIVDKELGAGIGYHPMPLEFEYEVDPFWFPEFHPQNREHGPCPDDMMERMCPVIRPMVSPEKYADAVKGNEAYPWLSDLGVMATPGDNPLDNYPSLARYVLPNMDLDALNDLMPLPFLGHMDEQVLSSSPQKIWPGVDDMSATDEIISGLHEAIWSFRDTSVEFMRFRHLLYQAAPGIYRLGWWYGALLPEIEVMFADWYASEKSFDDELSALEQARNAGSKSMVAKGQASTPTAGPPSKRPVTPPKGAVAEGEIK